MKTLILFGLAAIFILPSADLESGPDKKGTKTSVSASTEGEVNSAEISKKKPKKAKVQKKNGKGFKRKYNYRPGARQL